MGYTIVEVHEYIPEPFTPAATAVAVLERDPSNPFDIDPFAPIPARPAGERYAVREQGAAGGSSDVSDLAAWLAQQAWSEFAVSLARQFERTGTLSPKQIAAGMSMRAKCEARAAERAAREAREAVEAAQPVADLESFRIYVHGGATFAVVESREGRQYAKRLDGADWSYASGAIYSLRRAVAAGEARMLTRDEALAFGAAWGRCICCGRLLTQESSVEAGIGPVCAGKWGLQ